MLYEIKQTVETLNFLNNNQAIQPMSVQPHTRNETRNPSYHSFDSAMQIMLLSNVPVRLTLAAIN